MPQPVEALAASAQGIVVASPGLVSVLDRDGHRLRSISSVPARGVRRKALQLDGGESAPGLPAGADWARGYDREEMDDGDDPRLADETVSNASAAGADEVRPSSQRFKGRAQGSVLDAGPGTPATVTAGGGFAWLGLPAGLWRIDLENGATERARADEVPIVAASPDGQTVAFVHNYRLYRSHDAGKTFADDVALPAALRHLAAANAGGLLSVDADDGIVRGIDPTGGDVKNLGLPFAINVASCGDAIVVLRAGALRFIRTPASVPSTAVAAPSGTERIACDAGGRLLVASGPELRLSSNAGQSWSVIDGRPPGQITGLAVTESEIWIGASSGLWRIAMPLGPRDDNRSPVPLCGDCVSSNALMPDLTRRPPTASAWWPTLLPRVDLLFATAGVGQRHEVRGLVLLTFAMGGRQLLERTRDQAIVVKRHREQRASGGDACVAQSTTDPIVVEENAALAQALKESP